MIRLLLVVSLGSFLQTTLGFGMGIFVMMFLPAMFPYGTAVTISKIIGLVGSLMIIIRLHAHIDYRRMLPMTLPSLCVGLLATGISFQLDAALLKFTLGMALLLLSLYFLFLQPKTTFNPSMTKVVLLGALAGVGDGLFGIGGPPVALYCMACMEEKENYLASIHFHFFSTSLALILLRVSHGLEGENLGISLVVAFLGVFLGLGVGLAVFRRTSLSFLKRFVYLFVGANGLWTMLQNWGSW